MNNVTRANALAMVAGDVLLAVSDLVHVLPFVVGGSDFSMRD
jgi:hypothetical protein